MEYPCITWRGLKFHLGANYDVVLERDHIHIEYDPKGNFLKYPERRCI